MASFEVCVGGPTSAVQAPPAPLPAPGCGIVNKRPRDAADEGAADEDDGGVGKGSPGGVEGGAAAGSSSAVSVDPTDAAVADCVQMGFDAKACHAAVKTWRRKNGGKRGRVLGVLNLLNLLGVQ